MNEVVESRPVPQAQTNTVRGRVGNYRWTICALLFFAATINYIDRQVIGILKPILQTEIGWTEVGYSWVVFSFQAAYAIGFIFVGRLMDRIGTRKGFSLAIVFWSIAAMARAFSCLGSMPTPATSSSTRTRLLVSSCW